MIVIPFFQNLFGRGYIYKYLKIRLTVMAQQKVKDIEMQKLPQFVIQFLYNIFFPYMKKKEKGQLEGRQIAFPQNSKHL